MFFPASDVTATPPEVTSSLDLLSVEFVGFSFPPSRLSSSTPLDDNDNDGAVDDGGAWGSNGCCDGDCRGCADEGEEIDERIVEHGFPALSVDDGAVAVDIAAFWVVEEWGCRDVIVVYKKIYNRSAGNPEGAKLIFFLE